MSELVARLSASVPDIQSAYTISAEGSARVKLDIPESDLPELLKLIAFAQGNLLRLEVYKEHNAETG